MKENLVVIGENGALNKNLGEQLSITLELNYLDFNDYCEYVSMTTKEDIIAKSGEERFKEIQYEILPEMVDFCGSVIGFDGDIERIPYIYEVLSNTAYIICVSDSDKKQIVGRADICIKPQNKSVEKIKEEIIQKLGEL